MKKVLLLTILMGLVLFFYACAPGYVTTQPTEIEIVRPPRPNDNYVWINGEWVWRRHTHTYIQRNGFWSAPNRSRTYRPGQWNHTPRGHQWQKGRWQ